MVVNTVVVKVLGRGAKANEKKKKKLVGWQKNEMRCLIFKECEQKVYSFLDEDVPNIFE